MMYKFLHIVFTTSHFMKHFESMNILELLFAKHGYLEYSTHKTKYALSKDSTATKMIQNRCSPKIQSKNNIPEILNAKNVTAPTKCITCWRNVPVNDNLPHVNKVLAQTQTINKYCQKCIGRTIFISIKLLFIQLICFLLLLFCILN
jgi:hypothetical protein